jgi:hypothetical protein
MSDELNEPDAPEPTKVVKAKPTKILPTDRLAFDKQLSVLRGYVAASGPERKAVSNKDVGSIVQIHENTVSICNPFFQDLGLLVKEGMKTRPSEGVADYAQAYEWDSEKAAFKLAPVFRTAWFGTALIPKLSFRSLTKDEATTFLANEAKAPKEYKPNLEIVLEYLKASGVIHYDGATITLGPNARESTDPAAPPNGASQTSVNTDQALSSNAPPQTPERQQPHMEPLISGLISKLPPSDSDWSLADRAKWLNAAANIFDLMYKDEQDAGITITLEGKTLSVKKGST